MTEEVVGGSTILIGGDADGFVAAVGSAIQAAERMEKEITSKVGRAVTALAGVTIPDIGKLAKVDSQAIIQFSKLATELKGDEAAAYRLDLALKGVNKTIADSLVGNFVKIKDELRQIENVKLFAGFEKSLAAASGLGEVEKRINALTTSMERLTGEERKAAEQALQLARAQEQASRTKTDNDNYVAALAKRTNAIGKSFAQLQLEEVALLKQEAAMRGVSAQAAPYIAKIEAAALATQKMGVSAGQTKQALAQLPAQFTDIFTSLAGGINPLLVLVQQGGQIKDSFGGLGNTLEGLKSVITPVRIGLGLIAGAVVALGLAYKQGSAEQDAYAKGLILTGGAAGASVGQINEMAKAISASAGTQGEAAEVLAQLAASGTVSASVMQRAADAAIRMERAGGQAAAETAKQIAELGKDPVAAVLKLNDGLNFLTRSTFDQIKALQDVGATTQAAKVAQEAYADAVLQRSAALEARLGTFEKAWRGLGDIAKSAWDKMLNIGRPKTLEETVAEAEAAVLRAQERLAGRGTRRGGSVAELSGAPARASTDLEDAKAYRDTQLEALKIRDKLVEKAAAEALLSQKIGEASKLTEAALGSQAKYEKEIASARETMRLAGVKPEDIEKTLTQMRQVSDYQAKIWAASAATAEGAYALAAEKIKARLEEIQSQVKQGKLTPVAAIDLTGEQNVALLKEENALLQVQLKIAKDHFENRGGVLAVEAKITENLQKQKDAGAATNNKYQEYVQSLVKAERELAVTQKEAADKEWKQYQDDLTKKFEAAKRALIAYNEQLDNEIELTDVQKRLIGSTNTERDVAIAKLKIEQKLRKDIYDIEHSGQSLTDQASQKRAKEELAAKESANATTKIYLDAWQRTYDEISSGLADALMGGAKTAAAYIKDLFRSMVLKPIIQATLSPVTGAITNAITGGIGGGLGLGNLTSAGGGIGGAYNSFAMSSFGQSIGLSTAPTVGNNISAFSQSLTPTGELLKSAGTWFSYGDALLQAGAGKWGTAAGGAIGTYIAGPIGGMIGKLLGSAADQLFAGGAGTPHTGGYVQSDAFGNFTDITSRQGGIQNADTQASVKALVGPLTAVLNQTAQAFSQGAGYGLRAVFEADGKDAAEALFQVMKDGVDTVVGFEQTKNSTLASDPSKAFTQFSDQAAQAVRVALLKLDLPTWAKEQLNALGDAVSASDLANGVKAINDAQAAIVKFTSSLKPMTGLMGELGALSSDAVYALAKMSGGIDVLSGNLSTYYQAFYSDAEQSANSLSLISATLKDVGLAVPDTRESFRALVEAQDLTSESGQKAFAALLSVSGAFDKLIGSAFDKLIGSAEQAQIALDKAVKTVFAKFQTPTQQSQSKYENIAGSIFGAGVGNSFESVLQAIIGASKDDIYTFAQAFLKIDSNSVAAKTAVVNAAGALFDLKDSAEKAAKAVHDTLMAAINSALSKFQSPAERQQTAYQNIATSLQSVGVGTGDPGFLGRLMGASKQQIYEFTEQFLRLSDVSDEVKTAVVNAAAGLADLKDTAEKAAASLSVTIEAALSKFQTPGQQTLNRYTGIANDLKAAGVNVPLSAIIGASKQDIYDFAAQFVYLSGASDSAKTAVANAAGALFDLKDSADKSAAAITDSFLSIAEKFLTPSQVAEQRYGQIQSSLKKVGIDIPLENLIGASKQDIYSFAQSFIGLSGVTDDAKNAVVAAASALADLVDQANALPKAIAEYRTTTLADAIEQARLGTLKPEDRIARLRDTERSLFAQLPTAEDPIAVAQKLQSVIVSRIQEETSLRDKLNATTNDALNKQIDALKNMKGLANDIAQFTGSISFSDLSPLNPLLQVGSAQSLYEKTLVSAKSGDAFAQGNLLSNARAYLEEAASAYASGPAYASIFDRVTRELNDFGKTADLDVSPQLKASQDQVDSLDDISGYSKDMLDALLSIDRLLGGRVGESLASATSDGSNVVTPIVSAGNQIDTGASAQIVIAAPKDYSADIANQTVQLTAIAGYLQTVAAQTSRLPEAADRQVAHIRVDQEGFLQLISGVAAMRDELDQIKSELKVGGMPA